MNFAPKKFKSSTFVSLNVIVFFLSLLSLQLRPIVTAALKLCNVHVAKRPSLAIIGVGRASLMLGYVDEAKPYS
jgi:hypothetical protein